MAQRVPVPCLIMGATGREDKARGMCHSCEDIAGAGRKASSTHNVSPHSSECDMVRFHVVVPTP